MTTRRPRVAQRTRVPQYRVAETVAGELRSRILAGDVEHQLPTQEQLVNEFGVSYPSIREALRILETEGLITVRRGNIGGAEVHKPDESSAAYHLGLALQGARVSLGDLANGLQLLEPLCAAECARRPDRAETVVPVLEANLAAAADLFEDGVAFTQAGREFHDLLVSLSPNVTVRYVVNSLVALWSAQEQAWAEQLTLRGEYFSRESATDSLRAHRRITDAITDGADEEAERLVRAHLAATQAALLARFDDDVVDASSPRARLAINSIRHQPG